ncbi:MAG: uridylate kinase [Chloroflexi bacterium CFX4]|nr:uridylate kinase [Chloroflexi bacterium CFX4]MDL1922521.1 isopentenyl phosphate kinase family protein [Chloroflexi bacterium CFX3]
MLTFLKLGGSLITDKRGQQAYRPEIMARTAAEIADAYTPAQPLLIGHGSGSFGHVTAQKYGTAQGVHTAADWEGFAAVSLVARRLNALVLEALCAAGLPVLGFQPSASARCEAGKLISMESALISLALSRRLVPLVHGDVAFDSLHGGTILSTEAIFFYLAERLQPARILLLGETEGVYDANGEVIPRITPHTFGEVAAALGGSGGTDVTGGMLAKVQAMLALIVRVAGLQVQIMSGTEAGQITAALRGDLHIGTLIAAQ